jgi:hypothetical protein
MRSPVVRTSRPFAVSSLLVVVFLVTVSQHAAASPQKDHATFERLEQKALAGGTVPVIVRLQVPGIETLRATSASAPTVGTSHAAMLRLEAADSALTDAIDTVSSELISTLAETTFTVNRTYRTIPFMALRVAPDALAVLKVSGLVTAIQEDVPVRLRDPEPSTPDGSTAATIDAPQLDVSVPLIGAPTAWSMGYTGAGWYVAILDTGIRSTHQMFSGKSIVEACFAVGRDGYAGAGDCPNGRATQTGTGAAAHYSSTYDGYDHGTHVAGIAAGNNGSLFGVAKDASIIAVQVFSKFTAGDCEDTSPCIMTWDSDTIAALEYVYSIRRSYHIAAINMSLGGEDRFSSSCDSDAHTSIITNLRTAGIATAIAAGNEGWCTGISAPACISTAVSVGATNDVDNLTNWTNWHATLVDLLAPGARIFSSTGVSDTGYASWDGTSMATPHVTGAFAIMKHAVANGTVADFLTAFRDSGVPITSACDSRQTALPRIRVDRAISALTRYTLTLQASPFGTTDPSPGTYTYTGGTDVTITATPVTYATLVGWSGSVSGTTNPLTVTMNSNKTVTATFQYVYAPTVAGRRVANRSFSQIEYVNVITFGSSAANAGLTIRYYRVYQITGSTWTKLADVDASTDTYLHRQAGSSAATYAVVAVTSAGMEGAPATVTIN